MKYSTFIYETLWKNDTLLLRLEHYSVSEILVTDLKHGIITIKTPIDCDIHDLSQVISGLFSDESNFSSEVLKFFLGNNNFSVSDFNFKIKFVFNETTIVVSKDLADADIIYGTLLKASDFYTHDKSYNLKGSDFNTHDKSHNLNALDFYNHNKACNLKDSDFYTYNYDKLYVLVNNNKSNKLNILDEIDLLDQTTELLLLNDSAKARWDKLAASGKNYFVVINAINFARRWAKYMQKFIAEGKSIQSIASQTLKDCSVNNNGLTRELFKFAVLILADNWKYGKELRQWCDETYGIL